jgi:Mg-chelatase subunit ChlD
MTRKSRGGPSWMPAALLGLAIVVVFSFASCALLGGTKETKAPGPASGGSAMGESEAKPEKPAVPTESGATGTGGGSEAAKSAETRGAEADIEGKGGGEVDFMAEEVAPPAAAPGGERSERTARTGAPAASGLRAGFADDNEQFNYFVDFLERYGPQVYHYVIPVQERVVFRVRDGRGRSVPNASVTVADESGLQLTSGLTYADGSFQFFPAEFGQGERYRLRVAYNQQTRELQFERGGRRELDITMPTPRGELARVPLDILFVLDTTGSMGEEIQRLKTTIEIINLNLSSLSSRPRVRFGMVLYRDRRDEYVTRVVPFTENLQSFQEALDAVSAAGGGDTPEDLQSALQQAVKLEWNRDGVRLAFIITDAPPHLDYGQSFTYVDAAKAAKADGIKIFSVGTGGLDLSGEYVLRQISQYTSAKYIFLTYGESGESEGGAPGSVSHHTGANYQTDKLEAIIIRLAREELAELSDQPLEQGEDYFEATKIPNEAGEETLRKLFAMAVSQLSDYASVRLRPGTPAAVLPLSAAQPALALDAEYFTEQLVLSLGQKGAGGELFRLVERQDLQKVLGELELQLSDLADAGEGSQATRVGELVGAEILIVGKLYAKQDGFELFLKLLRVDTGEVLSVTKAVIDRRLGLEA